MYVADGASRQLRFFAYDGVALMHLQLYSSRYWWAPCPVAPVRPAKPFLRWMSTDPDHAPDVSFGAMAVPRYVYLKISTATVLFKTRIRRRRSPTPSGGFSNYQAKCRPGTLPAATGVAMGAFWSRIAERPRYSSSTKWKAH